MRQGHRYLGGRQRKEWSRRGGKRCGHRRSKFQGCPSVWPTERRDKNRAEVRARGTLKNSIEIDVGVTQVEVTRRDAFNKIVFHSQLRLSSHAHLNPLTLSKKPLEKKQQQQKQQHCIPKPAPTRMNRSVRENVFLTVQFEKTFLQQSKLKKTFPLPSSSSRCFLNPLPPSNAVRKQKKIF